LIDSIQNNYFSAACLLFRGQNIIPKEIGQKLILRLKQNFQCSEQSLVELRSGIDHHCPLIFNDYSDLALTDRQILMLTNETSTALHLCRLIIEQSNKTNQSFHVEKDFQEIKHGYEQLENEILS